MNIDHIKFYLKRPNLDSESSIFAVVHLKEGPFKYYIRKSIYPKLWDKELGSPTMDKKLIKEWKRQDPSIQIVLENTSSHIRKIQDAIVTYINLREQAGELVTSELLKEHLNAKFGFGKKSKRSVTLKGYVKQFIQEIESGKRLTSKKQEYAVGTIKNYKGFQVQFLEYQQNRKRTLKFENIDLDFYDDYVNFFQEKDYTPNTIGRHIKNLKVIMRAAQEDGLHSNDDYKRFRVLTSPVDAIYLTEDEITKIKGVDLSSNPNYELARDIFLLGCYTGLRYSDYSRIRPVHVRYENDEVTDLCMYINKTNRQTVIPLKPEAKEILKKYQYNIPNTHEQKVNKYIKEIGKMAKIDQPTEILEYKGASKLKSVVPKYKLITTHTARRSAATNMFKAGVERRLIMRITGHQTESNFLKYIRISNEEAADMLRQHKFFKGNSKSNNQNN